MWYKLNIYKLAICLIPTFLRLPKRVALVKCLVRPLVELHDRWLITRDSNLYKITHTGQTCLFRKVLNDFLDDDLRRIYTTQGNSTNNVYVYRSSDKQKYNLENKYVYRSVDYVDNGIDFTVHVPESVYKQNLHKLQYLIEFYKPASKRYNIQVI